MAISNAERAFLDARNVLSQERSKEKTSRILQSRGLSANQASELVEAVFADNKRTNRKTAITKMLLSAGSLVLFGGIYLFTGRLFYIILPIAAFGFLWGLISAFTASGWDIQTSEH